MPDFETRLIFSAVDNASAKMQAVADGAIALSGQAEQASSRYSRSMDAIRQSMAVLDEGDYGASLRAALKENQFAVDGFSQHMDQAFARIHQQARVRMAGVEMSLRNLGVRPLADVRREIKNLGDSYEFAKNNGASAGELAIARQNLNQKVRDLAQEYSAIRSGRAPGRVDDKRESMLSGALSGLAIRAGGVLGGVFAVEEITSQVKEVSTLAARYDTLGVSMHNVGENAGYSSQQTDAAAASLERTGISALESRQSIARLIAANLDLSKATQLARLAQDAAVVGNMNSSEAYAALVEGIQSARVETLRTIGINVSFEESYRKMALSLGTTSDALTETQKMQARLNEVLNFSPRLAGTYEAAMGTVGKQMLSLERYTENFKVALGAVFQPALTEHVKKTSELFKEWTETLKDPSVKSNLTAIVSLLAKAAEYAVKAVAFPVAAVGATVRDWKLADQLQYYQERGLLPEDNRPAAAPQKRQARPPLNPDSFVADEEGASSSRAPFNPDSFIPDERDEQSPEAPASRGVDPEFLKLTPQQMQAYFNSPAFKRKVAEDERRRKDWLDKNWPGAAAPQPKGPEPLNGYQYALYEAELVRKGTIEEHDLDSYSPEDQRMFLDEFRRQDWEKAHPAQPDAQRESGRLAKAREDNQRIRRSEYLSNYLVQTKPYASEHEQLEKATAVWTGERQQIQGHWLDASMVGDTDAMRQAEEALARADQKLIETRKQINKSFEEGAQSAKAYLNSLHDENTALAQQFQGETLASSLAKNQREYNRDLAEVEKRKREAKPGTDLGDYDAAKGELASRKAMKDRLAHLEYFQKDLQDVSGFYSAMASTGHGDPYEAKKLSAVASAQQDSIKAGADQERQTRIQLKLEAELAQIERDKATARENARAELAQLTGNVREELSAEIEVLKIQLEQAHTEEERATIREKIAQKASRRDLDAGRLTRQGMDQYASQSFNDFADKIQNTIPDAFRAASEASASFFEDAVKGAGDLKKVLDTVKGAIAKLAVELVISGIKSTALSAFGFGPGQASAPKPQGGDGAQLMSALPWGFWTTPVPGRESGNTAVAPTPPPVSKGWQANRNTLVSAAMAAGVDPGVMAKLAGFESGGYNPNAANSGSSAKGLFQFTSGTWRDMLAKYGSKYDLSPTASVFDPRANALMGAEYVKENQEAVRKALGREAGEKDIYATHLLGTTGGVNFLKALAENPNQGADQVVSAEALKANAGVFKQGGRVKSLQEVYDSFGGFLDRFSGEAADARRIASSSDSPYGSFGRDGVQGVSSAVQSYGAMGLLAGPMGARSLLSQFPTNNGLAGFFTGQSVENYTENSASYSMGSAAIVPAVATFGASGVGFAGSGASSDTANAMVANLVAYHGMSPQAATAYVSSLGYSPQATAAQAQTAQARNSSGFSVSDLAKSPFSGIGNAIDNFGFSNLGIGTLSTDAFSGLSASDVLITTAGGQTIAVPASDVASTLALNEGATVSGSASGLAGTEGAAVSSGLGSALSGVAGGVGLGLTAANLIYPNGTGTAGGAVGAAGGAAAGAAIGSVIPGVGTVIGGFVGGLFGGAGGSLLTGGETSKTEATGEKGATVMVAGPMASTLEGYQVNRTTTSGMFGSSGTSHSKQGTGYIDPDTARAWNNAWIPQSASVNRSMRELNMNLDSWRNFDFPLSFDVSTSNASAAAGNVGNYMSLEAINANKMKESFDAAARSGEIYSDEIKRIGDAYSTGAVSAGNAATSLENLAGTTDKVFQGNWFSQFSDLMGGNDKAAAAFTTYSDYALSKSDAVDAKLSTYATGAGNAIAQLGDPSVNINNFWSKYKAAQSGPMDPVEAQSWAEAANWMKQFDDTERAAGQTMQAINSQRIAQLDLEMRTVQNVKVMVDGLDVSVSSAYSTLKGLSDSLTTTIQGIEWNSNLSFNTPLQTYDQQKDYYNQLKARVQGEDSSSVSYSADVQQLSSFATTFLQTSRSVNGPSAAFATDQQDVLSTLGALQTQTQSEVAVLKQQLQAQDAILNADQAQVDQLTTTNANLAILASSLDGLGTSIASGLQALGATMSWTPNTAAAVNAANQAEAALLASFGFQGGFAAGGDFGAGSMLVGERGPEFIRTSLSGNVTSNTDLRDIFDTGHLHLAMRQNTQVTAMGLKAILDENQAMREEMTQIRILLSERSSEPARAYR